jgi:Flp pilus assembly protein TadB
VSGSLALACLAVAGAVALAVPGAMPWPGDGATASPPPSAQGGAERGRLHRAAWPLSAMAGLGAALFVGGVAGVVIGPAVAALCRRAIRRSEDPASRRRREQAAAELPHLVLLLGAALRGGAPPDAAVLVVSTALPGPVTERLGPVRARIALGLDPATVWDSLADDEVLAPLARTLGRAGRSGIPVADAVERLAEDLDERHRAEREDRARAVGVRAAVPLGLCLLPAFLLLGIVPLVAGLFTEVTR